MFKSIFSKYLATFTTILLACITAILLAVSSRIAADSYAIQRDTMNSSVGSASLVIDIYIEEGGYESIYSSFYRGSDLQKLKNGEFLERAGRAIAKGVLESF